MSGSLSSGPDGWHVVLGPEGEVGEVGEVMTYTGPRAYQGLSVPP